jgi:hypothetical protein
MSTSTSTYSPTTAAELAPEQALTFLLDPRRPAREGRFVEAGDKPGTVRVRYEVKGNQERFAEVPLERVLLENDPAAFGEDLGDLADLAAAEDVPAAAVQDETPAEVPAESATEPTRGPAKAPLRAGYVTPTGLCREINARGLYTGGAGELRVQALYSYLRNAPATHPSPFAEVDGRYSAPLEDALGWWTAKNERVATRAAQRAERPARAGSAVRQAEAAKRTADREAAKAAAALDKANEALRAAQERATTARAAALAATTAAEQAAQHLADVQAAEANAPAA